jgi:[ribosomal protein S5]-alanine N-acetyltransferase
MAESPISYGEMSASLSTQRLVLDAFHMDDAPELHEIFSDPATHTIGGGPLSHLDETKGWIERRIAARRDFGLCWYGVRDRMRGRLIGNCGVFAGRTGPAEPEIGYMIRREVQGHGYASEAAAAVMSECARARLRRVWATVRPSNAASVRILERIRMELHHKEEDDRGTLLFLTRTFSASEQESSVGGAGL